jgi:plasmid replication initiation protein
MNEEKYVVKSNQLIEAQGKVEFTTLELKLFLTLLSEIEINDNTEKTNYKINIRKFFNFIGRQKIGGKEYKELHEAGEGLITKKVFIGPNDKYKRGLRVTFLSSIDTSEKGDFVELGFDKKLKPYLIDLKKQFTQYQIKNILRLTSVYAIRIYELLKQYETIRKRTFELEVLRNFLHVGDKYDRFSDFERRVLKTAWKEINLYTDLSIDYEKIKKGRRINKIKFEISPSVRDKDKELLDFLLPDEQYKRLMKEFGLEGFNLNKKQLSRIWELAGNKVNHIEQVDVKEYINICVNYAKEKKPSSFYGYLLKTIKGDYPKAITILKLLNK